MNICEPIVRSITDHLSEALSLRDSFIEKDDGSYVSEGDLPIQSLVKNYFLECLPNHYGLCFFNRVGDTHISKFGGL